MNYLNTVTTPEGILFVGVSSQPDDYVLPDNAVNTEDLTIPTAVTDLGITDWETFSSSGILRFYRLVLPNTLVLRTIDRYYYTVPSDKIYVNFSATGETTSAENLEAEQFVVTEYAGQEEPPLVCYSESDDVSYDGVTYLTGQQLVIYEWPNPPIPSGFVSLPLVGTVPPYVTAQWDGTTWILSSFPISLNLAGAQDYLTRYVQANASALINNQLSSYDMAQIAEAADPELLVPRYTSVNLYPTIGDYRTAVDAEIAPKLAAIAAAVAVEDLYDFNPTVSEPPNYI